MSQQAPSSKESHKDQIQRVQKAAEMHLSILRAELRYLRQADCLTDPIRDEVFNLARLWGTPRDPLNTLDKPLTMAVIEGCIGSNEDQMIAQKGEYLIVVARNTEIAMAYNPGNDVVGRIPLTHLVLTNNTLRIDAQICVFRENWKRNWNEGSLRWSEGDRVRIYHWKLEKRLNFVEGFGQNLATKQFGYFHACNTDMQAVDQAGKGVEHDFRPRREDEPKRGRLLQD